MKKDYCNLGVYQLLYISAIKKIKSEAIHKKREDIYSNSKPLQEEENMETYGENEAIHKKVKEAILHLPEKYRIPIHLKYVEGFELEAIASILQLNGNTLRSLIKRGLEKISLQLKDEKITLSSVGLIGLIKTLPMEISPVTLKSMASNIFSSTHSSSVLLSGVPTKATIISLKSILSLIAIGAVGSLLYFNYYKNNFNSNILPINVKKSETILPIDLALENKNTNGVWISYQKPSNVKILFGNYQWSKENQSLVSEIDKTLMLSLPINNQKMPFVLECLVAPNAIDLTKDLKILFRVYWAEGIIIPKHEFFIPKEKRVGYTADFKTQKFYCYKNFICSVLNDKLVGIFKFEGDLSKAQVSIFSKNIKIQKIESRTINIEEVPTEILQAIEEKMHESGVTQESWTVTEDNLAR